MADPRSAGERGVFVLGMHRSGTSAITRAINLLGLPTGRGEELKEASSRNERGFWEVKALTTFNDRLLSLLGGTWSAPPTLPGDWLGDPRIESERATAREVFGELHPTEQWVWKDPRNCVTMPFWVSELPATPAVVLVHRHPTEIWRSLDVRDGFSKELALALWERYLGAALSAAEGLPTLVVRYSDVLDSPIAWCAQARRFLGELGFAVAGEEADTEVEAFLDRGLRHTAVEEGSALRDPEASDEQRRLFEVLEDLAGVHPQLHVGPLPEQTAWAEPLLAERRRADLEIEPLRFRAKRLDVELRVARKQLTRSQALVKEREQRVAARELALERARATVRDLEASVSWRLTAPLRWLARRLRRPG